MTPTPADAFAAALDRYEANYGVPPRLLVGFSGGVDSTLLLKLCRDRYASRTEAVHVNHGYSRAAQSWQAHCRELCAGLGVTLIERELDVSEASEATFTEAEARTGRYQQFRSLLADDELLLLAHHEDDQLETLLLHVLQGRGLFGMPECRPLGAGRLLRPLLATSRSAIEAAARAQGLRWIDDPSNLDRRHDRSFLRGDVLPLLKARFDALPTRLGGLAGRLSAQEALLVEAFGLDVPALPLAVLEGRAPGQAAALLRLWLLRRGAPPAPESGLEDFVRRLGDAQDRQPALNLKTATLHRYRDAVHLAPALTPELEARTVRAGETLVLAQGTLYLGARTGAAGDSAEPLALSFCGAPEAAGLRLEVGGHERGLGELLRQRGVPPWQRPGYPLLCDARGPLLLPGVAVREGAGLSLATAGRWEPTVWEAPDR